MIRKTVVALVRKKLGLKKYEQFRFVNQKSKVEFYWFTDDSVMKQCQNGFICKSSVSLNWLLDKDCEIVKIGNGENSRCGNVS